MNSMICLGVTKFGNPCRAKAGSSGYCLMHDPASIAKREQERQVQEAAEQAAQARCKPLREIIAVMKATCEGKSWRVSEQHFDDKTGQHASLEVHRIFNKGGMYDSVTGILDVTFHRGHSIQFSLQGTSFYKYGIDDLRKAIELQLDRLFARFEDPKKSSQVTTTDALQKLVFLLKRFHRAAHQLTQRHNNRSGMPPIKDEHDVQDILHAFLLTLFDDVRAEDPVPNHAGKASRLDFFLKKEKIMIEVKMTSKTLRDERIGEQLIVDIERYKARSDCQTLVCFVYDLGRYLKNPKALEDDLSRKHDRLTVQVIVYCP